MRARSTNSTSGFTRRAPSCRCRVASSHYPDSPLRPSATCTPRLGRHLVTSPTISRRSGPYPLAADGPTTSAPLTSWRAATPEEGSPVWEERSALVLERRLVPLLQILP